MKVLPYILPASLSLCASLYAGVITDTYESAQALNPKDGYVLLAYPDGWDKHADKNTRRWLASKALLQATGDTAIIPVPIPQVATDETKLQQSQILGKLSLPKAGIYPALFLMDANGRHYATIADPGMRRMPADELASLLAQSIENGRKQKKLLDKAQALPPSKEKAELLGQASIIPDLTRPHNVLKELKKLDPDDTLGYIRRLSFNPWSFASSTATKWTFEESEAKIIAMLEDPAYSTEQKQKICATYIGLLRRKGGSDNMERMAEMIDKMRALNPYDLQAKSADIITRDWLYRFSLTEGWCPYVLPEKDNAPIQLHGEIEISGPGTYELIFQYTSGNNRLNLAAVELYDGDTKIAEDRHPGYSGKPSHANVYTLKVQAPVSNPKILVYVNTQKQRNTYGNIILKKK